ncbi:MAG: phenylalanine--tRNA ligase subunit beta [Terrimicrobiaceae bacterium]
MKVSLSWLAEYIDLPEGSGALEDLLTNAGLTVEGKQTHGADYPFVVVAKILESSPHPDADRLSVCQVNDGSEHPRQIVCGAKNYKVGDKVPLAMPGAVLPGDFKIKTGKLRGVESQGMLCSARELLLPGDDSGLLILPEDALVGAPISTLFPSDTVLELEVTPNRPDCLSHVGVAREISAFTGHPVRYPESPDVAVNENESHEVREPEACPFYSLRRITLPPQPPAPPWLTGRLAAVGLRPIHPVVDVTNYVLMELGQPLHAFDADKVHGKIRVRHAMEGEIFSALDDKSYTLSGQDLVIADDHGPIALAGIIGGAGSAVSDSTTSLLLESAWFEPTGIRRSARRLGLSTDSSYRFERGVDPQGVLPASSRATELIIHHAGGQADPMMIQGILPPAPAAVPLRVSYCCDVLGTEISHQHIVEALTAFGLTLGDEGLWKIPSYRSDLTREIDLIEEVARHVGISRIPSKLSVVPAPVGAADRVFDFVASLRSTLSASGFSEARTSSLISAEQAEGYQNIVRLRNPLGEDQAILRPGLAPALLAVLAKNLRFGEKSIRLFEIGKVFHEEGEELLLGLALTGPVQPSHWQSADPSVLDFFGVKGLLGFLSLEFGPGIADGRWIVRSKISVTNHPVGWLGQLSPALGRAMDAADPVFVVEIRLRTLVERNASGPVTYLPIPEFPSTARDIAIVCPLTLAYATIAHEISSTAEPLLAGFDAFDVFHDPTGNKLPADSKSLAISLTFRSPDRTLNTEEVNAATDRIKARLKSALAVGFRE